jgi:hypothetical protein
MTAAEWKNFSAQRVLRAVTAISASGTNRTSSDVRLESALRGKADSMCSKRVFPLLTQLRHQT